MNALVQKLILVVFAGLSIGCASVNDAKIQDPILLDSNLKNPPVESNVYSADVVDDISYENLHSYITNKNYPKITLDYSMGNLISESKILTYSLKGMQRYYHNNLCRNIYWYNCKSNIANLYDYSGVDIESMTSFARNGVESVVGYKVKYNTVDYYGNSQQVSGSVLIPTTREKLKGVVIVYHHTVLDKRNAPSSFYKDFFNQSLMLASAMSSDGYVVLMPDYLGVGDDESNVHPYIIYPEVNALSGIYMLPLISQLNESLSYRKIKNKIPVYITGYSEGASYAVWATKILQDNQQYLNNYAYTLRRTAPVSGAYNLSHIMLNSLLASEESNFGFQEGIIQKMIRPGLVANVLVSYNNFEYKSDESNVFSSNFAKCKDGSNCIYKLIQESGGELAKYKNIYNKAKQAGYAKDGDSILPLINHNLLEGSHALRARFESADIYNWQVKTPINLITLKNINNTPFCFKN